MIACSAAMTACGLGGRWQVAIHLFHVTWKKQNVFTPHLRSCQYYGDPMLLHTVLQ